MVQIILKDMGKNEYAGKLTFRTQLGVECSVNLPNLYDGLRVGYDGMVKLPPQVDFELMDLKTEVIYININYEFSMFYELVLDYTATDILLKVNFMK